jgi:diguanylate cyclase (GGDEF)-like protein
MISIKKYLDQKTSEPVAVIPVPESIDLSAMECYRAALTCIGENAARILAGPGVDLEANLTGLAKRLAANPTVDSLKETESKVEVLLGEWGDKTADHFKGKADEVKELLITLAKTAESVSNKDRGSSTQFKELIGRIEKIADLNDLTTIRTSLVQRVTELKKGVTQMAQDSQDLVANLKSQVSIYETRLKSVEHLAYRDELTMVANRRSVEERLRNSIANGQPFCVVMLDLNHFKQVNDHYGHNAGDDLLKQFAKELQLNTRSGDLVGRWGGDEFVVVLACEKTGAQAHVTRIHDWVFGKYKILQDRGTPPVEIHLDASIGLAEWHPGETLQHVIEKADKAMYIDKNKSRLQTA